MNLLIFEPNLKQYPFICSNWVNRSVFEFFNKADSENVVKLLSLMYIECCTRIVYALKVIPERNITMLPEKIVLIFRHLVVDDTGEELINTSDFYGEENSNSRK